MSRRQLIQSLAMAATAAAAAGGTTVAAADEGKGFEAIAVNHISYQVKDYTKTRDFYASLLGMKPIKDDGKQCYLTFGDHGELAAPAQRSRRECRAESGPHRLYDQRLGPEKSGSRAKAPRSRSARRHGEQLPREGSRRVRSADQRRRDEADGSVRHRVQQRVDAERVAFGRERVRSSAVVAFALERVAEIGVVRHQHHHPATLVEDRRARAARRSPAPRSDVCPPVPTQKSIDGICGTRCHDVQQVKDRVSRSEVDDRKLVRRQRLAASPLPRC